MMAVKKKYCKGKGKTSGYGCGVYGYIKRVGLCYNCYLKWLRESDAGKELLNKSIFRSKKKVDTEKKHELKEKKESVKKHNKSADFYNSSAWKYCSKYVLLYYADHDGIVECCTSGLRYQLPNKNIQCGHYFKSNEHEGTAFEFCNLGPQSYRDNKYFSGKPEIMKEWLIKTHGELVIDFLNNKKNRVYKLDKTELERYKEVYKKLFNDLVKERGFNPWAKH
jgi:Bacteriophage Lambda NinG protein